MTWYRCHPRTAMSAFSEDRFWYGHAFSRISDYKVMTVLSVTYPKQSGTFFDLDYYIHKHMTLVKTVLTPLGLESYELLHGRESMTGSEPVYEMTALLKFADAAICHAALAQHGKQIVDDISNFTDMKATMQINELQD